MEVAEPQLLNRQQLVPELQRLLAAGANSHDLLVVAAHFRRMELERWLWGHLQGQIAAGPFRGLHYPEQAHGSTLAPKMLGTYEKEIQTDLMGFAADARTFLNIGCAEGYYTTGLAARADLLQVVGVDVDQRALQAAIANAQLNGVNHQCQFTADLQTAIGWLEHLDLVLIDVDGAELDVLARLFTASNEQALSKAILIIETDFHADQHSNRPEIIASLVEHDFQIQAERKQSIHNRFSDFPDLNLPRNFFDQCLLGLEGRPSDQSWLIASKAER
jgi:SAM-dependent methyltransferase